MCKLKNVIDKNKYDAKIINAIHDEILVEVHKDEAEDVEQQLYDVNRMEYMICQARRTPGSSMPKEAWSSLSDDAKKIWDQLPPEDKAKILNASVERAKKKTTSVNNHELNHGQDEEEASVAGLQVNKTAVTDGEN